MRRSLAAGANILRTQRPSFRFPRTNNPEARPVPLGHAAELETACAGRDGQCRNPDRNRPRYDRHDGAPLHGEKFSGVAAVSGLLPLWLPDLPEERLAPLLAAIADPKMFNTPVPLPSVAANTPHFSTDMW